MGQKMMAVVVKGYLRRQVVLLLLTLGAALVLSSGVALALNQIDCGSLEQDPLTAACFGTPDTLEGTSGYYRIFAGGGADTLRGLGHYDHLFGQGGSDELFGGLAGDYLIGGPGQDSLSGGGGYDEYYFDNGWGKDLITDGSAAGNGVVFARGFFEDVVVTEDLTISMVTGGGPEAKNESATNTVNWDGSVIDYVRGGAGADEITGNSFGNYIVGEAGADIILGRGGDDQILVDDGLSGDIVDCGPGNDTVRYDPGDDISDNCEAQELVD